MNFRISILIVSLFILTLVSACKEPTDNGGDDPTPALPRLAVSNISLNEGSDNSVFNFKVSMSETSSESVSVDFITDEITAGEDIDFIAKSGTVTLAPGELESFIEITIVGDTLQEQDEEFKVFLSNPVNATIQTATGIGTIRNDDTYVFIPEDGYITPESYTGYELVWGDEFDGSSLNTDDWNYEIGTGSGGWGNNELQYYTDRAVNSRVSDGRLTIEAHAESYQGSPYTSARLTTQGKETVTFGRVDIRAILPEGQGIWPALWMLGSNITSVGWPHCGEIDVMELVGHEPHKVHGTAHWGPQGNTWSYNDGEAYTLSGGSKYSDEYNVFSIIWEPNSIKWMVNDTEYYSINPNNVNGNYPFNGDFFFIFNIAVGGNWPGSPDNTTSFPQQMIVDYIRVFQED